MIGRGWLHGWRWRVLRWQTGVLVYITRYRPDPLRDYGIYATLQRYSLITASLWMAVIGTSIIVTQNLRQENHPYKGWIYAGGAAFLAVLGGLYLAGNIWAAQRIAVEFNHPIGGNSPRSEEECVNWYALHRDESCLLELVGFLDETDVYKLAVYGLASFRNHEMIPVLPPTYRSGSPLILDTPSPWMNAYLRRWYLGDVTEAEIFHIAPANEAIAELKAPLDDWAFDYSPETADQLTTFVESSQTVWYLRTREVQHNEAEFTAIMADLGYLPTVIPSADFRYNTELTLIRYEQEPQLLDDPLEWENSLRLVAWTALADDLDALVCQPITLQSWWTGAEVLPNNYALNAVLIEANGTVISESQSALTPVPSQFWEPEQLYLDERSFFVPCELPPGEYELVLRVNDSPEVSLRAWSLE